MNFPKVTIITPVLNGEKYLRDTILSVLSQTYDNIEYIIFDGGSTDGTDMIIAEYSTNISLYRKQTDQSMYDALNKAIQASTGDIIGIVNSDDFLFDKEVIFKVVDVFNSFPSFDFVHGCVNVVDSKGLKIGHSCPVGDEEIFYRMYYEMPLLHPTLFLKRIVYKELGLFNLNYRIVADYEFVLRLLNSKFKGHQVGFTVSNYRVGGMSGSIKGLLETLKLHKEVRVCLFRRLWIFFLSLLKMIIVSKFPPRILKILISAKSRHQASINV